MGSQAQADAVYRISTLGISLHMSLGIMSYFHLLSVYLANIHCFNLKHLFEYRAYLNLNYWMAKVHWTWTPFCFIEQYILSFTIWLSYKHTWLRCKALIRTQKPYSNLYHQMEQVCWAWTYLHQWVWYLLFPLLSVFELCKGSRQRPLVPPINGDGNVLWASLPSMYVLHGPDK